MFALWMFGSVIERALGSKRFLLYYISCGFGAALIQEGVFAIMVSKYHSIFTPQEFDLIVNRGLQLIQTGYNYTDPSAGALNALVNGQVVGASGAIYGVCILYTYPSQREKRQTLLPSSD